MEGNDCNPPFLSREPLEPTVLRREPLEPTVLRVLKLPLVFRVTPFLSREPLEPIVLGRKPLESPASKYGNFGTVSF